MSTINILIDKNSIENNNNKITGKICFYINNNYFPDSDWNDFLVIVLNWWIDSLVNIISNNKLYYDFMFMDGPFLVRVNLKNEKKIKLNLIKRGIKEKAIYSCESDINELAEVIFKTTKEIINFVEYKNWISDEINELKKSFLQLKNINSPRSSP
jgi:hypothetical protein